MGGGDFYMENPRRGGVSGWAGAKGRGAGRVFPEIRGGGG